MPPHLWGAHSTQPYKPKVAFTIVGGLYRPTHRCTLVPSRTQTVWKAHWLRVAKLGVAYYTDASNERSLLPGHSTPHRARKIEVLSIIASLVDLAWCRTLSSIHVLPLFFLSKKNSKIGNFLELLCHSFTVHMSTLLGPSPRSPTESEPAFPQNSTKIFFFLF